MNDSIPAWAWIAKLMKNRQPGATPGYWVGYQRLLNWNRFFLLCGWLTAVDLTLGSWLESVESSSHDS